MKTNHLSVREQQEYLIDQPVPGVLRHLAECAECRTAVDQLESSVKIFRDAAVMWSAECLAARPRQWQFARARKSTANARRWVMATALPLIFLLCVFLGLHLTSAPPAHTEAKISDDVLLEQVDEQLSVAVPSSMESLTHLVSADGSQRTAAAATALGGETLVQTN